MMKRLIATFFTAMLITALAKAGDVKYVFYFIGDGMGMGHVNAAQYYNSTVVGGGDRLLMQSFPYSAMCTTHSATQRVTDSAAAGTALATGSKTANGVIGLGPDSTTMLTSIATRLKRDSWGVAIVTSVAADDATPSAFYGHQPSRSMSYELDCDASDSEFDFIGGSRLKGAKRKEGGLAKMTRNYKLYTSTDDKISDKVERVLLLTPDFKSSIGYAIDSMSGAMHLDAMTRMALNFLEKRSPDKFFMMVESGDIDHAAHANDGGTVVKEILAFQDAIKVAYDFYLRHPNETLIVVTADHDTGGLAMNSKGDMALINYQRISKDRFSDYCRDIIKESESVGWHDMKKVLTDKLGLYGPVRVNGIHNKELKDAFNRTFITHNGQDEKTLYNTFNEFTKMVFDIVNYRTGLAFTTRGHSGNPVPVYAIGRGAEHFTGCLDNTDIPRLIMLQSATTSR